VLVAVDANALFSIALGRAAFRVIRDGRVEIATTLATVQEVKQHLDEVAGKYHIRPGIVGGRLEALDVKTYGRRKYRNRMAEATRRIGW